MNAEFNCEVCNAPVNHTSQLCQNCEIIIMEADQHVGPTSNISLINCPECNQGNDLNNQVCVYCQNSMYPGEQVKKLKCDICDEMILDTLYNEHKNHCLLSMEQIKKLKQSEQFAEELKKSEIQCQHCFLNFPKDLLQQHLQVCEQNFMRIKGIEQKKLNQYAIHLQDQEKSNLLDIKRLSELQKNAVFHMHKVSRSRHIASRKKIEEKTLKLGYKLQDLQNLQFYIQNYAPIIIHMHITKHMQFFVNDTHYRNQFETGKSSGSLNRVSRTQWEDRLFDRTYSKATDSQRVKYGVINFTNDPKGVNCANPYGLSYFLLKSHVRPRCTITNKDSSVNDAKIGTFKSCFHVIQTMTDKQLNSAFRAAKALEQSSNVTSTYKQIQIHGPVEFGKDIERIYANKKQLADKKYLDMVYQFSTKFGVEIEFI